ncbi:MAG: hypothetical protein NDJ89_14230 [Oligoflexia bacterium]|nr:hypothetical protein [Oligoflexia bacterium]
MKRQQSENIRDRRLARSLLTAAGALCISLALLSGCTNQRLKVTKLSRLSGTEASGSSGTLTKISSVTIAPTSAAAGSSYQTTVFFDTSQTTAPISNYCTNPTATDSASKPCLCQFAWQEVNSSTGTAIAIPRVVHTTVDNVQPSLVGCLAPEVYSTEILDGTLIKISVVPAPANSETFSVSAYNYTKSKSVDTNTFKDAQGRSFMNILRYGCYDRRQRGMAIQSKLGQLPNPNSANTGDIATYPIGNRFCVQRANSNGLSIEGCETLPPPEYTAQTYYYNLFIRESEVGDINPGNARYTCPTVKEALNATGSLGSEGKYWPLDSSFSLSLGRTADFPIGVVSNSKVSNPNDPTSVSTSCDTTSGSGSGTRGSTLNASCLGFAAKPNGDGTCPYFRDSTGAIRFTYRLRRYIAFYPPIFDTNGMPLEEPQATDTIYVVDRPVSAASNPDPLKPYTMRGPKPCPFAYFDHKSVLDPGNAAYSASYAGTNDSRWNGKNVDGIQLPNFDSANSCAATVPMVNADRSVMSLTTIHPGNLRSDLRRSYIRPVSSWAPHYVEDQDFQACAPLSDPFRDPPLHFARNGENVAWCAEVYPTQNDNVARLDAQVRATVSSRSGTANGKVTSITLGTQAVEESFAVTYNPATGRFDARGSVSGAITPSASTGAPNFSFTSSKLSFTIQQGTTPFSSASDGFTFLASASGSLKVVASAPSQTGTGTGTVTDASSSLAVTDPSAFETITATCSAAAANGGTFTVRDFAGNNLGAATVGVAFASAKINFTIVDGATDFVVGDKFTFSLSPSMVSHSGKVRPFTSHSVRNTSSTECSATLPTIPSNASVGAGYYPAGASGLANHDAADIFEGQVASKTCDRTVLNPLSGPSWSRFPLLAPPSDVENMLRSATDPSYVCTMTFDNGGAKTGKKSPSSGCCQAASVAVSSGGAVDTAHLEPDAACGLPQY